MLRASDTVGRLGGDEFVILTEGVSLAAGPGDGGRADPRGAAQAVPDRGVRGPVPSPSPPASASPTAIGRPPRNCSVTPTSPSTGPRPAARTATSSSSRPCSPRCSIASSSSRTSIRRWPTSSSSSSTNRCSTSRACASAGSRRCCAGSTRSAGSSRRTTSSPSSRTRGLIVEVGPLGPGRGVPQAAQLAPAGATGRPCRSTCPCASSRRTRFVDHVKRPWRRAAWRRPP